MQPLRQEGGARVGSFGKSRDDVADPFTFTLEDDRWNDGRPRILIKIEAGDAENEEDAAMARAVADFVGQNEEVTREEVDKRFGSSKATSNRYLWIAQDKGWIRKSDRKGGRNHQAAIWIPGNPPARFDEAGTGSTGS